MGLPDIYFNSWSEHFLRPFGAIQIGRSVYFTIKVDGVNIRSVHLVVQKDGEPSYAVPMIKSLDNSSTYSLRFQTTGKSGLYFYHFHVVYLEVGQEKSIYYAKAEDNYGGEGRLLADLSSVQQYQLTCYDHSDPAPDWYIEGVIYHIFVDRFYNGNRHQMIRNPKKNSFIYATKEDRPYYIRGQDGDIVRWDFYGGNLEGIIAKLHELKKLGVTILYLSPIFEARSNHKYDTANYLEIDPMFGDRKLFETLILKARRLGMHILLDGVFNHVGADSIYFNRFGNYGGGGAYQDPSSPYYQWFTFHNDHDHYDCWWNIADLPTVNKEQKSYRDFIYGSEESVINTWTKLGVGGWRLDVADELSDEFIEGIRQVLDQHNKKGEQKVLIGEVWEDASHKIAYDKRRHYLEGGMLHGVMNYPFRSLIINLLTEKQSAREAARASFTLRANYPHDAFLANMNNMGTHDTERIFTMLGGDQKKMRLAIWMLMTLPGVPCVYYGDEAGVEGGKDPDNRRYYPWGRENKKIYSEFQVSIQTRRVHPNLQKGLFLPFSMGKLFGYLRYLANDDYTAIIFNPTSEMTTIDCSKCIDEMHDQMINTCLEQLSIDQQTIAPWDFLLVHCGN
ncbi:glycoside hydrolase family 13 protein [Sporolactobacillus kofuensis]|uniref:Glycoside hydrolase family 13 protein n=1 Tax=Sporolactobacillus kofuensis TaxID=269672 RepID=A0ABW1WHK3_9BACL|nr:glycoside hydrolase family 13 protein [Sporolactobacillus kofuensis]MCO7176738.1 glycoside hydrolase family 13 protein [Sporolactobacillus kofuensis]